MRAKFTIVILVFCFAIPKGLYAQNQEDNRRDFSEILSIRGYIKDLRSMSFTGLENISVDNLIHNRLNFRYYANDHISFALENRNRLFYGTTVNANPNYGLLFDADGGIIDMSFLPIDENGLVFHSIIDRLWFDYSSERMNLRIGRQRINWGVNLVWNPNDIFNAYSFVDFDYEERPGSDAIRFEYFINDNSSLEGVVSAGNEFKDATMGMMYKFNKWAYDFQILVGGISHQFGPDDLVAGAGWAGNIKNAGFKGEISYFKSVTNFPTELADIWSASIGVDYAFPNSLYLNGSILYNTNSSLDDNQDELLAFYSTELSAKNLMPSEYNLFLQSSYTFSPIFNGSLSAIYGADLNLLFLNPLMAISIANNWELSLVGQFVFAPSETDKFANQGNGIFVRTKWSFSN